MAQITATFPFRHPSDNRRVNIGETLDVDDEYARTKIADGHATAMVITASPERPQPTFVEPQAIHVPPADSVQPAEPPAEQAPEDKPADPAPAGKKKS